MSVTNYKKSLANAVTTVRQLPLLVICALALWSALLPAAEPQDLYGAKVAASGSGQMNLNNAFDRALGQVLVKVTGRTDAAGLRRELFPDSRRLLLQYQQLDGNQVYAAFDGAAIRKALDAAGQPVWGEQRPLVAVWLAIDAGNGRRYILSDGSQDAASAQLAAHRTAILDAASSRGIPVVLPLLDATDLSLVSFSDVWGGFVDRMSRASARYSSEALLIGRVDGQSANTRNVRWAFVYAGEQSNWQGSLADGPTRVADMLARQDATTAGAADRVRLTVAGINSIAGYGDLRRYFEGLNMVAEVSVARVQSDQIEFDLILRGDSGRLRQVLSGSRLLAPTTGQEDSGVDYRYLAQR